MSPFRFAGVVLFLVFASATLRADDEAKCFEIPDGGFQEIRDFGNKLREEFSKRGKEYFEKYRAGKNTPEDDEAYCLFEKRFFETRDLIPDRILALPDLSVAAKQFAYQSKWSRARSIGQTARERIASLEKLLDQCKDVSDIDDVRSWMYSDWLSYSIGDETDAGRMEHWFSLLLDFLKKDEKTALHVCKDYFARLRELQVPKMAERMAADLDRLKEALKNSERKETRDFLSTLEGTVRYNGLVGREMELKGATMAGTEIDLADYRDKVVYVDFWATWCGPCIAEMPELHQMYDLLKNVGFEVLSYSIDKDGDALKAFMEKTKYTWPTIWVTPSEEKGFKNYYEYYGAGYVPKTILVGRDGKVIGVDIRGYALRRELFTLFEDVFKDDDREMPVNLRAEYYQHRIFHIPYEKNMPDAMLRSTLTFMKENRNHGGYEIANLGQSLTGFYRSRMTNNRATQEERQQMSEKYRSVLEQLIAELKDTENSHLRQFVEMAGEWLQSVNLPEKKAGDQ